MSEPLDESAQGAELACEQPAKVTMTLKEVDEHPGYQFPLHQPRHVAKQRARAMLNDHSLPRLVHMKCNVLLASLCRDPERALTYIEAAQRDCVHLRIFLSSYESLGKEYDPKWVADKMLINHYYDIIEKGIRDMRAAL